MKTKSTIILCIFLLVILVSGYSLYQKFYPAKVQAPIVNFGTQDNIYKNTEYGFEITLPDSWKGYSIEKQNWQGWNIDTGTQDYSGVKIIIKNPKTTIQQKWQDIPIMVFTPDIWKLVSGEKISVSAAPIGPSKIGENSKYVFATPPRWYGFTDDLGWQEAVDIVKTFKAF